MTIHLIKEIDKLKTALQSMGQLVDETLHAAVEVVLSGDKKLAVKVMQSDEMIDQRELEVEEECLKILALYQPVAKDLRFIVAALKINNDLERIGDMATNIAGRAFQLSALTPVTAPFDLRALCEKVTAMLHKSLEAMVKLDANMAEEVRRSDVQVDEIHRGMYEKTQTEMRKHPENCEQLILLLSVSKNLERIADLSTNIAEDVIYLVTGEIIRHKKQAMLR